MRDEPPALTAAAKRMALFALIPFLASIFFLGFGLANGVMLEFAIGWPLFLIGGYIASYRIGGGNLLSPMFTSQVAVHWIAMLLLIALFVRFA